MINIQLSLNTLHLTWKLEWNVLPYDADKVSINSYVKMKLKVGFELYSFCLHIGIPRDGELRVISTTDCYQV